MKFKKSYRITTTYGNKEINFTDLSEAENFFYSLPTTQRIHLYEVTSLGGDERYKENLKIIK